MAGKSRTCKDWIWGSELLGFWTFPSSGILETTIQNVSETWSVSVLRWGGKTPTQFGTLERANLDHWNGNRSSFRNVVFSSL
jgi:hypothetical protein